MSELRPKVRDALFSLSTDCGSFCTKLCVTCAKTKLIGKELHRLTAELEKVKAERDGLREVCAAAYQAAGAYDLPVRFLDALSDAASGEVGKRRKTKNLLPCGFPEDERREIHDKIPPSKSMRSETGNLNHWLKEEPHD